MNTQANKSEPGASTIPKNWHECRTYRDLLHIKPWTERGTCCACHKWGRETWRLSARASICRECIERKGDTVLGSVLKAERRARRWIKNHPDSRNNPKWLATLTGASVAFIEAEIARVKAASSSTPSTSQE